MSKQIVLGKVTGEQGEAGFSPIVDLSKKDGVLNISVTDVEGTKTESIVTGENVQGDFLETDTSKGSYIWNKPTIPSKVSELENDLNYQMKNTTYRLYKSGNSIILTGSDGISTSVLDADTDTTYGSADANNDGLMTKEFVQKLNSIAEGAQVNSITGIKGDNETSYRTGQVNITPENIGAAPTSHGTHVTYGTSTPLVAGIGAVGTAEGLARIDHVHPAQTNVANATKATQDESGNNIKASYASSVDLSTNNQLVLKSKSGATLSTVDLGGLGGGSTNIYNQTTEPAVSTSGATVWLVC